MAKKKIDILLMLQDMNVDLDEPTQKILRILERQKIMAENKIADRLKIKINATRKLLYKLQSRGLITYTKQRDEKKKWWYLYFWALDMDRINELYLAHLRKQLEQKREQMAAEAKFAFECKLCGEKHAYEEALETEFTCPKCGELMTEVADEKIVRRLKKEIEEIEIELIESAKPAPKPAVPKKSAKAKKAQPKKKKTATKKLAKKKAAKAAKPSKAPAKKKSLAKRVQSENKVSAAPKKRSLAKRVLRKILLKKT